MIANLLAATLMACAANDTIVSLDDVTITGQSKRDYLMRSSQTSVQVNRDFLENNFAGSLMQTLEGVPGVKAMSIGSGQSKPTIRGLGFNRLAVTEDGIKHEGQQWGDDHGLEIDQFAIDHVEVIKGPAALLYGSDAIGGVLSLYTNHIPLKPFEGAVQVFGRTNNEQMGLSAKIGGRIGRFFYRANTTLIDYADYKIPADSIQYYSYYIKLHKQRLRNTAGTERDGSITLGYAGYNFHTDVRISDNYSRSGFFANAHGLEVRLSDIDYDKSRRDIDLPLQSVNHLKVLSHTAWQSENSALDIRLAYQNNHRKECSEPISHGYMPKPDGTDERVFDKSTYTAAISLKKILSEQNTLNIGVNGEYQHNRRDGWGFIIPDFESVSTGAFVFDKHSIGEHLKLNAGVRYDFSRTRIHNYYDWYKTPVSASDSVYKQRSEAATRNFNSITWSAGINYSVGGWVLKANVGKSFRVPIPKELGADGINYHIFRYERGNKSLNPEESYQLDAGIHWSDKRLAIQIDPYVNFFPNYIYLNPTADYVEGLQLYQYTQAKVLRYGFEAQATYSIGKHWEAELKGEYLYARQKSGAKKGYTLPFSTPWSGDASIKYQFEKKGEGFAQLSIHVVGAQNEIVPPEKPTDGYCTLNASAGKHFAVGKNRLKIALHADNLLNKRYYNHTSYYRLIDVPEPGRNLSAMIGLDF
ncbi:MAG: TonB-dependent receptor [Bacteroidaceae bacterium]|nr:TonB-dependent receptor [Bacteroidaceae bacterium]